MTDTDLLQPDPGRLRAAPGAAELAQAASGLLSIDGCRPANNDPGGGPVTALAAPAASSRCLPAVSGGVDRAIRVSTAAVVLAVAGIAAYISYWHAYAVVREYGETGVTAQLDQVAAHGA